MFGAAGVSPQVAAAKSLKSCPNKAVKVVGAHTHIPVKNIQVQNLTCADAYKVIGELFGGKLPKGYVSKAAEFPVPSGFIPQELVKGSKRILYGVRAG